MSMRRATPSATSCAGGDRRRGALRCTTWSTCPTRRVLREGLSGGDHRVSGGHVAAFAFLGGVIQSILYDNTKLAVARILGMVVVRTAFSELRSPLPVRGQWSPARVTTGDGEGWWGMCAQLPGAGRRVSVECPPHAAWTAWTPLRGHKTIGPAWSGPGFQALDACDQRARSVQSRYRPDYSAPVAYGHCWLVPLRGGVSADRGHRQTQVLRATTSRSHPLPAIPKTGAHQAAWPVTYPRSPTLPGLLEAPRRGKRRCCGCWNTSHTMAVGCSPVGGHQLRRDKASGCPIEGRSTGSSNPYLPRVSVKTTRAHDYICCGATSPRCCCITTSCPASTKYAELSSISFAGSPPLPGPVAGRRRCGSWARQTPVSRSGAPPGRWPRRWPWGWRRCAPTPRRPGWT